MNRRILIVDDEEGIRELLAEALATNGYDVVTVADGEEAVAWLERQTANVMFLDLNLPGMNGIELCKRIRSMHPVACIYAMTGYSSVFELTECRDAGFDDYFLKPLKLDVVREAAAHGFAKIERWAGKRGADDSV